MDELTQAFEAPAARAAATAGPDICDRISVRDYVKEVEIGAFKSERGRTQRVRFNVVLEVSAHIAARDDDVDKVLSYDTITRAIEAELSEERLNLLETLAERIANTVLDDPRALRIFVRVEKLDRIPGALGVEIVRVRRRPDAPVLLAAEAPREAPQRAAANLLFLANDIAQDTRCLRRWAEACHQRGDAILLPFLPGFVPDALGAAARSMALLSMDQNAVRAAGLVDGAVLADSRTELDWALAEGHLPLIAPARIVAASAQPPIWDISAPARLAAWLAAEALGGQLIRVGWPAQPSAAGPFYGADEAEAYGAADL